MTDYELITLLDRGNHSVTACEAEVLETLLRRWPHWPAQWPTMRQLGVLYQMTRAYVPDSPELVAWREHAQRRYCAAKGP